MIRTVFLSSRACARSAAARVASSHDASERLLFAMLVDAIPLLRRVSCSQAARRQHDATRLSGGVVVGESPLADAYA